MNGDCEAATVESSSTASVASKLLDGLLRIHEAGSTGQRLWMRDVALNLDLSQFHFSRLFRAAFGLSPHVAYDEARADRARELLRDGRSEADVARRIGLRRPAELRAMLSKRT